MKRMFSARTALPLAAAVAAMVAAASVSTHAASDEGQQSVAGAAAAAGGGWTPRQAVAAAAGSEASGCRQQWWRQQRRQCFDRRRHGHDPLATGAAGAPAQPVAPAERCRAAATAAERRVAPVQETQRDLRGAAWMAAPAKARACRHIAARVATTRPAAPPFRDRRGRNRPPVATVRFTWCLDIRGMAMATATLGLRL